MSFAYNHTTLVGRLVRDPEIKKLSDNLNKLYFVLAVDRGYKKEDGGTGADFIPICIWGKTADLGKKMLKKGSPILISGRIQTRNYEKDNSKHFITEIIADSFQLLEKKSPSDNIEDLDLAAHAA